MYKMWFNVLSALLIASASVPALSQVVPSAQQGGGLGVRVGAGYSNFATDWSGRLGGPTVWVDFDVPKVPPSLSGLQLEVQGRDLNYNRTGADSKLRYYSFAGGVNYAWRYDPAFHPYAKFMIGLGYMSWGPESLITAPNYKHDSRIFYSPGGGVDVRAYKRLWVRGEYEYQWWADFLNGHALTPHGFTVGAFYDFSRFALTPYNP
jgi:hypothetical protein